MEKVASVSVNQLKNLKQILIQDIAMPLDFIFLSIILSVLSIL